MTKIFAQAPQTGCASLPIDAPESMWDGLPRQIMLWIDYDQPTPRKLFDHLQMAGYEAPGWLKAEPEMQALDHVPSKGTRCVLIYRAMVENWLRIEEADTTDASDGEVERVARALFKNDCLLAGHPVNWGRATPKNPRGYKTEISVWQSNARAAIAALSTPKVPEELKALALPIDVDFASLPDELDALSHAAARSGAGEGPLDIAYLCTCLEETSQRIRTLIADQKGEEAGRG